MRVGISTLHLGLDYVYRRGCLSKQSPRSGRGAWDYGYITQENAMEWMLMVGLVHSKKIQNE